MESPADLKIDLYSGLGEFADVEAPSSILMEYIPESLVKSRVLTKIAESAIVPIQQDRGVKRILINQVKDGVYKMPGMSLQILGGRKDAILIANKVHRLSKSAFAIGLITKLRKSKKAELTSSKLACKTVVVFSGVSRATEVPEDWLHKREFEKVEKIISDFLHGRWKVFVDPLHPQKIELEDAMVKLTTIRSGRKLLTTIDEKMQRPFQIRYLENTMNVLLKEGVINIDTTTNRTVFTVSESGKYLVPFKSSLTAVLGHELIHVYSHVLREECGIGHSCFSDALLEFATYDDISGGYIANVGPFYKFSTTLHEQETIMGVWKHTMKGRKRTLPLSENMLRYELNECLRFGHYTFSVEELISPELDFLKIVNVFKGVQKGVGENDLHRAIIKEDEGAIKDLLIRKGIRFSKFLIQQVCNIEKLVKDEKMIKVAFGIALNERLLTKVDLRKIFSSLATRVSVNRGYRSVAIFEWFLFQALPKCFLKYREKQEVHRLLQKRIIWSRKAAVKRKLTKMASLKRFSKF